ncbi:MAG: HIT domain-containing protein [Gammaproteobacteria bacterium]|nr:HIT domain-containing protein [Gammaproteobacteria bacterium]
MIDSALKQTTIFLAELPLSSLLLKNDSHYPWLILVPRVNNAQEIYQLDHNAQKNLIVEIAKISKLVDNIWHPDKINVGALGNIVKQLHIHVIARYKNDKTWPHSVWQPDQAVTEYSSSNISEIINKITFELQNLF